MHGQLVGVRLHPHDREVSALAPAGIELTPPRAERSTGPGHRDFAIVSDASIGLHEDMSRRDFTVNAIARRLEDGTLVDPFGGLGDLARRELRTIGRHSFREDPLRLVRALRFVSQLGFVPSGETVAQMRLEAGGLAHVSPERIGGGIAADAMGELSKLLLGREPARALRLARDTGILVQMIPEFEPAIGYRLDSERQPLPLDEHVFSVVQGAADSRASLAVRLAALLHDLGKPQVPPMAATPREARRSPRACWRGSDIRRGSSTTSCGSSPGTRSRSTARSTSSTRGGSSPSTGEVVAFDLVALKAADHRRQAGAGGRARGARDVPDAARAAAIEPAPASGSGGHGDDLQDDRVPRGPRARTGAADPARRGDRRPERNEPAWLLERAARELA